MVGKASECAAPSRTPTLTSSPTPASSPSWHRVPALIVTPKKPSRKPPPTTATQQPSSAAPALASGALGHLGARRVAIVTPYVPALTQLVCDYIEGEGISVLDSVALGVADNLAVGRLDTARLPQLARDLDRDGARTPSCSPPASRCPHWRQSS